MGVAAGKPSALMGQYARLKAAHPDAILLFRLGDFYEMFNEDAEAAARVLDLTLTARNRGEPDEVPLCGFPAHASQPYITRLLGAGFTVAVSEQVEVRGRGIMAREVVRVITPGTILEEESLEAGVPSLLVALAGCDDRFGIASVDFATGAVRATEAVGWPAARDEIERLAPRELLLAAELPAAVSAALTSGRPWAHAAMPEPETDGGPLARATAGTMAYVERAYRGRPGHLRQVERYELAGVLALDAATRRNLELFETLSGERRGSLLGVLDRTSTPMGARRLREWLLYPLLDAGAIGRRLDAVEELVADVALRERVTAALAGMGDLARLAGRVGARSAGPRDLAALAATLERVGTAREGLATAASPLLAELAAILDPQPTLVAVIAAALVEAPPATTRTPGFIRAGHHPEIDQLRGIARDGKGWLARFEADERQRTGIPSLKVRYNRVFGYYVEVTKPNLPLVPSDYERKQTLVGAERFVTPALKEYEAKVLGAEERLRALEAHCFAELLEAVAAQQLTLARTADALAGLDAVLALAAVAHHRGWTRPVLSHAPRVAITAGRHPVVEALADAAFVPNDACLDAEGPQLVILTGPNMGGKSTYLRQVALIVLLAQVGSFVPATAAEIGLVDRVFTRVGASDNLAAGESTFMVEMRETANILASLTPRSLVILDEIGRGTSTFDGISIAWAVAERLHDAPERPRTLFATHYHELTALPAERPRARNLSLAVAEWKGDIVFLRRIVDGPASRSYGVEVARLAGVPAPVVTRARELLRGLEAGSGPGARTPSAPASQQLPLFAAPAEALRAELASLDPERLTPMDALVELARLVEIARRNT